MISSSQRPLPDNTQHSQQTNIHAPGGIRTHDRNMRAAVDLRLRQRGYWDRLTEAIGRKKLKFYQIYADLNILSESVDVLKLRWIYTLQNTI